MAGRGIAGPILARGVTNVESSGEGFTVTTEEDEHDARYVVFITGAKRDLAMEPGYETDEDDTVDVNLRMETGLEGAYATEAVVRARNSYHLGGRRRRGGTVDPLEGEG